MLAAVIDGAAHYLAEYGSCGLVTGQDAVGDGNAVAARGRDDAGTNCWLSESPS